MSIGHVLATVKPQIHIILAKYWCIFSWVENILNPETSELSTILNLAKNI